MSSDAGPRDDGVRPPPGPPSGTPAEPGAPTVAAPPSSAIPPGIPARIGHYHIVGKIGEGGMGVVYEAVQDNPRRTVALKVIRPGLVSPEMLRRFEQESRVLARLQHSGIAQVYEAGAEDAGQGPQLYFAMEFIRGPALRRYLELRRPGPRQRLELLARICDAVHHAHQKGVIHRDLKPGNILVVEESSAAASPSSHASDAPTSVAVQPKILDFGVARLTDSDVQSTTLATDIGQLVGTLPYMSPEQAAGDPSQLDTRSDVYSLGVIAYELLTGRLPYDLGRKMIHEAVRIIREEEPTRMSALTSADGRPLRHLRGDVETIVGKALEKDKTRRYQSAAELAADVRRHLADEPVLARPASASYQLAKFARRNKALMGGAAAAFVMLVLGVIATSIQAVRATRAEAAALQERDRARAAERLEAEARTAAELARASEQTQRLAAEALAEQARRETARAQAVNTFLTDMLEAAEPDQKGRQVTVAEVLDDAAKRIEEGSLKDQPLVEMSVRIALGNTLRALGRFAEAEPQLARAVELSERAFGPDHVETAKALNFQALLLMHAGRMSEAETPCRRALEIRRARLGPVHKDLADSIGNLANISINRDLAEAEKLAREALEMRRRALGAEHTDVALGLSNLAAILQKQGRNREAEPLLREALAIHRSNRSGGRTLLASVAHNLGVSLIELGQYAESAAFLREAVDLRRELLGDAHPRLAQSLQVLSNVLSNLDQLPEAEQAAREALAIVRVAQPDSEALTLTLHALSSIRRQRGDFGEAAALLREALPIQRRILGERHPLIAASLTALAEALRRAGRLDEAEPLSREALALRRELLGNAHPDVAESLAILAAIETDGGRLRPAERHFREALDIDRRALGDAHPFVGTDWYSLGRVLYDQNKLPEAEACHRAALEIKRRTLPPGHSDRMRMQCLLAGLLAELGRFEEADSLAEEVLAIEAPRDDNTIALIQAEALSITGVSLAAAGRMDEAEQALLEGGRRFAAVADAANPRYAAQVRRIVDFYQRRDAAEPGRGHAAKADAWRREFEALRAAASRPASRPTTIPPAAAAAPASAASRPDASNRE